MVPNTTQPYPDDARDSFETAIQYAHRPTALPYQRRRPEETTLYQVVQEHAETFSAQGELETGTGLPQFVKDEFEAFLECGILAHGFLRLRCGACAQNTLVAFSCKRRGFAPLVTAPVFQAVPPLPLNNCRPYSHVSSSVFWAS